MISRHFIDVGSRRVHYRRCGEGPVLLMAHQSPRSSAEYEPLMRQWGAHFTCIAPDTPGFGQSDALADPGADIDAFADAVADFLDVLGLERVAAYGFHSGGIILAATLRRHPRRFSALAIGGYAIWTPDEMALFADAYLPPFRPSPYGEHLTWLWNRMLEQSWFFPWFAVTPEHRLSIPHADVARVDAAVSEMLDAGDAYRAGYGAVLRAPRDIPPPNAVTPPVLITAYDGDPLQAHIERLGAMPVGWSAAKVATPADHQAASLAFLRDHPGDACDWLPEADNEGFAHITGGGFAGAVHWCGTPGDTLHLHGPGEASNPADGMAIDLPGHGLSDPWTGDDWPAFVDAAAAHFGCTHVQWPATPVGDPDRLYPELTPDRFGSHLTAAWAIVRARHLFAPWYEVTAETALHFDPAALAPERLATEHRNWLRATAARAWHHALIDRRH